MSGLAPYSKVTSCRGCGGTQFHALHDFGDTPIADRLIDPLQPRDDLRAPMTLVQCAACGLAQIGETVVPEVLFDAHYPYYSSVSKALTAHFHASADALIETLGLDGSHLVVEAASNDGYMLRRFKEAGVPVLGIDPSDGPVA
ncbi:MAG: methyltransferase, partial [Okeania sp. SIO3H1]|nr:methyltransferase [Okeania sp. SIO3H1]